MRRSACLLPALLWVVIGSIFLGAVHDFSSLMASLRHDGQSIAQVAEANGVAVDTVIDAMVDAKAERLAEKVESGRITQAEADEKLADIEDRITDRVNGVDSDDQTDA